MSSDDRLEIEVKFLVGDLLRLRRRIVALGGAVTGERGYERNVRYDNAWDGLSRKGQLLRLRQDSAARLTYKGLPRQPVDSEVRVREELETTVGDFDVVDALLQRIGFAPRQVYEKYRETWRLNEVEIVLDELPFGDFVELEGPETALKTAAAALGLDWAQRILANYLVLLDELKRARELTFDDLTFANFAGLAASAHDVVAPADEPQP